MMQQALPRREGYRAQAREALLEIFASANDLPIGLFEERNDQIVRFATRSSLDDREAAYCRAIQDLPRGRQKCTQDQCLRAADVLDRGLEELTVCHAGLFSQAMPIKVDGVTRAVLLCGEVRIAGPGYEAQSLEKHHQAMEALGIEGEQRDELRDLLLQTKRFSPERLEQLKATLPRVGAWLYRLFDEEERLDRHVEKITHELQIRLQPVLAHAEILHLDLKDLPDLPTRVQERAREVLNTTFALSTIIHSMGEFLEEYHFARRPLAPLLEEARRIYAVEAGRRAVDIRLRLEPVSGREPALEISADHLQYALNNLLHNAIKYSFRGGPGRPRYVRISGKPAGNDYAVAFENYGVGILPEEIESRRIFEEDYQGELTRGEYRTGSGKGLYFADQIVQNHHGRIEVTSAPMGDASDGLEGHPHLNRFVVYLPYKQPQGEGV